MTTTRTNNEPTTIINPQTSASKSNREVKSSAFTSYYSEPQNAADLYRSLGHVADVTPEDIRYETLQGVLYMARKNDLAFTVQKKALVVGEHQSTINLNMPLRSAIYYGRIIEKLIEPRTIYRATPIAIPTPEFYMFYNGSKPQPAEQILNLSDSYLVNTDAPMLELKVKVININPSAHHPILDECHSLYEYSSFIQEIRDQELAGYPRDEAIAKAMDICIKRGVMVDFIKEHGSEVRNMIFTQFNLEDAKEVWKEEAREEGLKEGREEGREEGSWLTLVKSINALQKNLNLSLEDACRYSDATVAEYEHARKMLDL